jgi:hypothetical protein
MAFESPRFMLPLRLGMVNADGPQDLLVYAITRTGRVECTNYRTVRLPEASEIPAYVKGAGPAFFKAMFDQQVRRADMSAVFLEHAWDMGWCDPCASPPLSNEELRQAGVFWLGEGGGGSAFLTRLHVRYDAAHFPEDLVFQQTADRTSFQARFIVRHEWQGDHACDAAKSYRASLPKRRLEQAATLVGLTGWSAEDVRARMGIDAQGRHPEDARFAAAAARPWWENLWPKAPER